MFKVRGTWFGSLSYHILKGRWGWWVFNKLGGHKERITGKVNISWLWWRYVLCNLAIVDVFITNYSECPYCGEGFTFKQYYSTVHKGTTECNGCKEYS